MNETKKNNAIFKTLKAAYYPLFALLIALILMAFIIKLMGYDPLNAYQVLFTSSIKSAYGWGETLAMAIALIFSALSFSIADRSGLINLGASGQLYMGGIAGMLVATNFEGLPSIIHIPLVLIAGGLTGAAFGAIASLLKNQFGASEVVTTMMFNYIAMHFCTYLISGPMKNPASDLAQSKSALPSAVLPLLLKGTRLHAGIFIAIAAILFYYILMYHTTVGYQMRVVGMNPKVGEYAGLKIKTNQLLAMAIAGGMAGLGGAIQATVIDVRLTIDWVGNLGFDGLAVAFLGGHSPIGIAISSVFFGLLLSSANKMEMLAKVPSSVVFLFQGIIIALIIGRRIFQLGLIAKWKSNYQNKKSEASDLLEMTRDAEKTKQDALALKQMTKKGSEE
ncbi:MAG: inner-rane translocator [Anaerocolumna sp.]|jgi:simple sugar transport system permease protein|nr:inner-rane translocator [Anaerocolumna sp.]